MDLAWINVLTCKGTDHWHEHVRGSYLSVLSDSLKSFRRPFLQGFNHRVCTLLMRHVNVWAQLCLTLCDPVDYSPPGSYVHGILQARILEWVAMPSSRGSSRPRDQRVLVRPPVIPAGGWRPRTHGFSSLLYPQMLCGLRQVTYPLRYLWNDDFQLADL